MDALLRTHTVIGVPLAVVGQIPAQGGPSHADRHDPKSHPWSGPGHVLLYQSTENNQQRRKLQSLKNAPQQFKGHSLIPSAFLLPGKTEKPFICVKHACHLLLPYPHPSPACGPPTSERRGDTVSTTPHVFPHPGFFPDPPQRFGLHRLWYSSGGR